MNNDKEEKALQASLLMMKKQMETKMGKGTSKSTSKNKKVSEQDELLKRLKTK